ncbi:crotonase/enoyl-CoA hydratase family protein [Undibacterium sp.]|uniref:crotonase/enoyl-CoA hydratase family protein n=1 Tax=Undibacterium sp. TaxID=1914977 RepID=UPI002C0D4BE1|nr:crotonase/enoyl-CoA hydratase family protein [Undibacterium sp.]HTD04006.1 crotonase/enoyl-CoA hydratase family protein [Undibacterium sp.]
MQFVEIHTDGPVCTIVINRPEKRNAVDRHVATELRQAFLQLETDDALRVGVLCGAGGSFCAGADLSAVGDPARSNEVEADGGGMGPMGPTRMALKKPLIAAISGHAVAGGLELALLADMRVADEDAILGVFCRRWGVPLIDGGTIRLPRIIGMGRALDLILTGRPVDAAEALGMGLVNRVVPSGSARQTAEQLAHLIAAFPQQCMLTDRASAYRQWDLPLHEALQQEGARGARIVLEEGVTGAARFVGGAGRHGTFDN